jgi:hypothetical protein
MKNKVISILFNNGMEIVGRFVSETFHLSVLLVNHQKVTSHSVKDLLCITLNLLMRFQKVGNNIQVD